MSPNNEFVKQRHVLKKYIMKQNVTSLVYQSYISVRRLTLDSWDEQNREAKHYHLYSNVNEK